MRTLTKEDARANLGPEEVALRLEAEKLWQAYQDAHNAFEVRKADVRAEKESALAAILARHAAEIDAFDSEVDSDPRLSDLKDAKESAWKAWDECPLGDLETTSDDDGNEIPERCVVCGLVISEDDQVVHTGDWRDKPALRGALGLPLIPEEEEADEEESDEAAA